jgi:hypothetical protein
MKFDDIIYIDTRENNHKDENKHSRAFRFHQRLTNHQYGYKKLGTGFYKGYSQTKGTGGDLFYYRKDIPAELSVGDFCFNGYVFEYKTFNDLKTSIFSGHLQSQIDNAQKALLNEDIRRYCVICEGDSYLDFNDKNFFSNKFAKNIDFISLDTEEECFNFMINAWLDDTPAYNSTLGTVEPFNMGLNALKPLLTRNQINKLHKQYPIYSIMDICELSESNYQKALGKKTGSYVYNRIHVTVKGGGK